MTHPRIWRAMLGAGQCRAPLLVTIIVWLQPLPGPRHTLNPGDAAMVGMSPNWEIVSRKNCVRCPHRVLRSAGRVLPSPAQPSHTFLTHEKIFHISSSVDGVRCLYTLCTPLVPHCGQRERLCCAVLVRGCVAGPGRRNSCPAAAGCCCCTARAGPRLSAGPGGGLLVVRETARGEESVAMLGPQQQPGAKSETRQ